MYDEAADFREHIVQLERMDDALREAKVDVDWPRSTICDIGGGGGSHAGLLASRAARVHSADLIDQNARYHGEFVKLLAEKFRRYERSLPIDRLEFNVTDARDLIYRDERFDFVCSINAFEHIPHPGDALREIARILRPGAYAYLSFDPLWTADTGSHFQSRVPEPWAHLVLDDDVFAEQMLGAGADRSEVDEFRGAMNRLRLPVYDELFRHAAARFGLLLVWDRRWTGVANPEATQHPNFGRALALSYSEEELLTRGMAAIFRKVALRPA